VSDITLVHVGIRPTHRLEYYEGRKRQETYHEIFPNGSYRIWTKKMLKSGCGKKIKTIKQLLGLIYCPYCDEYFSRDQFKEM